MNSAASNSILQAIRRAVADPDLAVLADSVLLGRFRDGRDEAVFAAILRRHGPMVLDVCRSLIPNDTDVEDAFQATFLVFSRSLGRIRKSGSLSSWLHGVAYRTAMKARGAFAARQKHQSRLPPRPSIEPDDLSWREIRQILHEELDRLPPRYRAPLLLCYLQGRSQDDASSELGLPKGTLKGRLERARALLRSKLVKRGLGPAAALIASAWPGSVESAGVPAVLAVGAAKLAFGVAAPPAVSALSQGVLRTMFANKVKSVAAIALLALCAMAGAVGWLGRDALWAQPPAGGGPPPGVPDVKPAAKADGGGSSVVKDQTELEGSWKLVAEEHNGLRQKAEFKSYRMTFKGKDVTTAWIRGTGGSGGSISQFLVDLTGDPKRLAISGGEFSIDASYKLDGKQLTIAYFGLPNNARPRGFNVKDVFKTPFTTPIEPAAERPILILRVLERTADVEPSPQETPAAKPVFKYKDERLQGTWVLVKTERDGKIQPAGDKLFELIVDGDKMTCTRGDSMIWEGDLKIIDSRSKPAKYDLKITSKQRLTNAPQHGIYEIDGGELKTRSSATDTSRGFEGTEWVRPKDFNGKTGHDTVFFWRRLK